MKKNLSYLFFTLIAGILLSGSNLIGMDQKTKAETQRQRFQSLFSEDTIAYLNSKEVSGELKAKLDAVFCKPEVEKALAILYNRYHNSHDAKRQAKDVLTKNGFVFFYLELHVYTHSLFPEFIFKHSYDPTDELLHTGRIRYAQELQEKNICTCKEIKIKCPHKQAYMPYLDKKETLPLVIVVAEKIDGSTLRCISKEQYKTLKEIGFYDVRPYVNAAALGKDIMVYDTEPHHATLNYPQRNALNSTDKTALHVSLAGWLCAAAWIGYQWFKR